MQISIETTTQSSSILTASFGAGRTAGTDQKAKNEPAGAPALSVLEAASKKAEEDAVVIAALRAAVEKGKGGDEDEAEDGALATIEDYQKTAGQLKSALGGETGGGPSSFAYESGTITTTTIEAEVGDQSISAEFVSFERVSYNAATGLSVRSASAANIEAEVGGVSASYQSASVSSLYAGTGAQAAALGDLIA
ncbi:MAG: hypothetical protein JJ902_00820 [Roseibium sp.]|nr:hypothetical protein [Roseibium sp.]